MVNRSRKRYNIPTPAEPKQVEQAVQLHAQSLDFSKLPVSALRRYRERYQLPTREPATLDGYMLGGPVGQLTWTRQHVERDPPQYVADAMKMSFDQEQIREGDAIAEFVYAVEHKDEVFKIDFGGLGPPAFVDNTRG